MQTFRLIVGIDEIKKIIFLSLAYFEFSLFCTFEFSQNSLQKNFLRYQKLTRKQFYYTKRILITRFIVIAHSSSREALRAATFRNHLKFSYTNSRKY